MEFELQVTVEPRNKIIEWKGLCDYLDLVPRLYEVAGEYPMHLMGVKHFRGDLEKAKSDAENCVASIRRNDFFIIRERFAMPLNGDAEGLMPPLLCYELDIVLDAVWANIGRIPPLCDAIGMHPARNILQRVKGGERWHLIGRLPAAIPDPGAHFSRNIRIVNEHFQIQMAPALRIISDTNSALDAGWIA